MGAEDGCATSCLRLRESLAEAPHSRQADAEGEGSRQGAAEAHQAGWRKGSPATKARDRPPAAFLGLGAGRGLTSALLPAAPNPDTSCGQAPGPPPCSPPQTLPSILPDTLGSCPWPAALAAVAPHHPPAPLSGCAARSLATRQSWAQTRAQHSHFCSLGLLACRSCQPFQHHLACTWEHVPPSRPPTKLAQLFHLRVSAQLRPWLPCSVGPCLSLGSGVKPPAWRAAPRHSPTQCPGSGTLRGCPSRSGCRRSCRSSRTCWTCHCCICGEPLRRVGLSARLPSPSCSLNPPSPRSPSRRPPGGWSSPRPPWSWPCIKEGRRVENLEGLPVGCGREVGAAGGPGGPPGHLCPKTGEGGLRLDGWPPAPEGRASSGVGAARPGPGPRQAPGTDGLTAGDVQQLAVDGRDPQVGRAVSKTTVKHCGGVPMPISP